jgi:hypothetical protein
MRQTFAIWFVPFHKADVSFVVVLHLVKTSDETVANHNPDDKSIRFSSEQHSRYYITSQEDHYQVNEFIRFLIPGLGPVFIAIWQFFNTLLCLVGVILLITFFRVPTLIGRLRSSRRSI